MVDVYFVELLSDQLPHSLHRITPLRLRGQSTKGIGKLHVRHEITKGLSRIFPDYFTVERGRYVDIWKTLGKNLIEDYFRGVTLSPQDP